MFGTRARNAFFHVGEGTFGLIGFSHFAMNAMFFQLVSTFPTSCGVYVMRDAKGIVIYVGKAKNLKARVRQYLQGHDTRPQIAFLMQRVERIDYLQTHSETEALLLENSLIKKHRPKYNVFLKDDKTYAGFKLTINEDYPRLLTTRRVKKDGARYFGPFTSSAALWQVKEFIDRHFQLRTCSDHEFAQRKRPCLEHDIKRCTAPCVGHISQADYAKQVHAVLLLLTGRSGTLKKNVMGQMRAFAQNEDFEEAARLRDFLSGLEVILQTQNVTALKFDHVDVIVLQRAQNKVGVAVLIVRKGDVIDARYHVLPAIEDTADFLRHFLLQYYTDQKFIPSQILVENVYAEWGGLEEVLAQRAGHKVVIKRPQKGVKKELVTLAHTNLKSHIEQDDQSEKNRQALLLRLKDTFILTRVPYRIECYDVSNLSGSDAVASMVVFSDGEQNEAGYRRFKIRTVKGPNDFAMLREVFVRRFQNTKGDWLKPDLTLVDGGKGQLKQVLSVFAELNVTGTDVVAIAK
ncbi:MAG: hypothetical protein ACD_62C00350G0020, partial [uncultured bacterium]